MSLENPALLPLLVLAFLPIILHLLDRRRARTVVWPAVRFLLAADKRVLRRLRLLEALLILSRTFAIFFVVVAVLGPFRTESVLRRDMGDRQRGAVISVDTSFSMAYRGGPGEPSSLERARNMALHLLEEFRPGDQVVLIGDQSGGRDRALAEDPRAGSEKERGDVDATARGADDAKPRTGIPYDLEAVRARVRELGFRSGTFRLTRALDRAIDALDTLATETHEVFILTDLSATSFPAEDAATLTLMASRLRSLPARPTLWLLDCGAMAPRNRGISFVRSGPLAAGTDAETKFEVGVIQSAGEDAAAEPIVVRLLSGLEELAVGRVTTGAARTTVVEISHRFDRGGVHRLTTRIDPDGLEEDDSFHHLLEVHERFPILVAGAPPRDSGPARFVDLALSPTAPGSEDVVGVFQSDFTDQLESETLETLSRYPVVILCDISRPTPETLRELETYVRSGGGLLLFCGERTHPDSWNRQALRGRYGLLPGRLSSRQTSGPFASLHPTRVRTDHPALSVFSSPDEGDLERINIRRFTRLVDLDPDAVVLAAIDAGDDAPPWIVEKACGRGRVILFTTSAAPDDTDLPRTSLFLPLLHQFARYLATTDWTERQVQCGQPLEVPLEGGTPADAFVVANPNGAEHPLVTEVEGGRPVGVFRDTTIPGFYEVRGPRGAQSRAEPRVFAVNFPGGESDLARLADERLRELSDRLGLQAARSVDDVTGRLVEVETRRPLWPHAMLAAVAFAFAELLLTHRLGRRRG